MDPENLGKAYNKIAEWWTNTQLKNLEYGMEYICKAMGFSKENSKFLDIGCGGTGRVISEALKHNFQITGIDVSSEMIKLAKTKHPDITFINEDFIKWETTCKYDLIIAWDSTFHAPMHLQEDVTIKMCSLLNPEGILLFTSGAYAGEASGKMVGVLFEYGTIGYRGYLDVIEQMGCKIILIEEDQYPSGHLVIICQKQ